MAKPFKLWMAAAIALAGVVALAISWSSSSRIDPQASPNAPPAVNDTVTHSVNQTAKIVSGSSNPKIILVNDVIGNKEVITEDDAGQLMQTFFESENELEVQRWVLVVAGDLLRKAQMESSIRASLESFILQATAHSLWRIRLTSIAAIDGTYFAKDERMIERLRVLEKDQEERVSARARVVLERR